MAKKALITGIFGQDGLYLAHFLLKKRYKVYGLYYKNCETLKKKYKFFVNKVTIIKGDISDKKLIYEIVDKFKFDEIYNLAAQSSVVKSWELKKDTYKFNCIGSINILQALTITSRKTKLFQASSSEIFGQSDSKKNESSILNPQSPYAESKLAAHINTKIYRDTNDLHCSNGILFNHESPLRKDEFIIKKIPSQLCEIKFGKRAKIELGDIEIKRDWGYAKDYVEAMWIILQQEKGEDFIICSGKEHSIKDYINLCASYLEIDLIWRGKGKNYRGINKQNNKVIIIANKKYFRKNDIKNNLGDPSKIKSKLKWKAKTDLKKLVKIMCDFELKKHS